MPYVNSLVEAEVLEPGPTTDSLGSKSDQVVISRTSLSFTDRSIEFRCVDWLLMVPGC